MRISLLHLFFCLYVLQAAAQVTLVRTAPNDTFNLACEQCSMKVVDVAITQGQHAIPMNMKKPVSVNLLMWRYFDNILQKEVLTTNEPFWTQGFQLLEEIPPSEMLSLHINLNWIDSTGQTHRFYLVLAGLTKDFLKGLPVETTYDPDTYAPLRFAAVAQITTGDNDDWETYDCFEGNCHLNSINTKTGALSGTFEFQGNRVGMEKKGIFLNGVFTK